MIDNFVNVLKILFALLKMNFISSFANFELKYPVKSCIMITTVKPK